MNRDYQRLAYQRTILAYLQRHLVDDFVESDGPAKSQLICEEVFYTDRQVPQDMLMEVLDTLQEMEVGIRLQMTQFDFRRKDVQPSKTGTTEAERAESSAQPAPGPDEKASGS